MPILNLKFKSVFMITKSNFYSIVFFVSLLISITACNESMESLSNENNLGNNQIVKIDDYFLAKSLEKVSMKNYMGSIKILEKYTNYKFEPNRSFYESFYDNTTKLYDIKNDQVFLILKISFQRMKGTNKVFSNIFDRKILLHNGNKNIIPIGSNIKNVDFPLFNYGGRKIAIKKANGFSILIPFITSDKILQKKLKLSMLDNKGERVFLTISTDKNEKYIAKIKNNRKLLSNNNISKKLDTILNQKPTLFFKSDVNNVLKTIIIDRISKQPEYKKNYGPKDIEIFHWYYDHFTDAKNKSIIISFYNEKESHSNGWAELWLIEKDNSWAMIKKIADNDRIKVRKIIDINNEGIKELLVESLKGGQGYYIREYEMISLNRSIQHSIYNKLAKSNCDARPNGEDEINEYKFKDIDGDNIIELIKINKKFQCKDYSPADSNISELIYKYQNGRYNKIISNFVQ